MTTNVTGIETRTILIPTHAASIAADLSLPAEPRGLVIFAHGSGSSRKSPRNRQVAAVLNEGGFATLLLDLLTSEEEALDAVTGEHRFDIGLLSTRLVDATDWLLSHPRAYELGEKRLARLPIGYFGASTGAAAALVAAALRPRAVRAVVSRGGRPDMAARYLPTVCAPTLCVVGGDDQEVAALNREAIALMARAETRLEIVPGATHLFEEPGALERVAAAAREWFTAHLVGQTVAAVPGSHRSEPW